MNVPDTSRSHPYVPGRSSRCEGTPTLRLPHLEQRRLLSACVALAPAEQMVVSLHEALPPDDEPPQLFETARDFRRERRCLHVSGTGVAPIGLPAQ